MMGEEGSDVGSKALGVSEVELSSLLGTSPLLLLILPQNRFLKLGRCSLLGEISSAGSPTSNLSSSSASSSGSDFSNEESALEDDAKGSERPSGTGGAGGGCRPYWSMRL